MDLNSTSQGGACLPVHLVLRLGEQNDLLKSMSLLFEVYLFGTRHQDHDGVIFEVAEAEAKLLLF